MTIHLDIIDYQDMTPQERDGAADLLDATKSIDKDLSEFAQLLLENHIHAIKHKVNKLCYLEDHHMGHIHN